MGVLTTSCFYCSSCFSSLDLYKGRGTEQNVSNAVLGPPATANCLVLSFFSVTKKSTLTHCCGFRLHSVQIPRASADLPSSCIYLRLTTGCAKCLGWFGKKKPSLVPTSPPQMYILGWNFKREQATMLLFFGVCFVPAWSLPTLKNGMCIKPGT